MAKKLGRNDPCWCGSGKKYKRCHLEREYQERENPWEAEQELHKAYSKRTCSVPPDWKSECRGPAIRAHTVPKSTSLKSISREGHGYGYGPTGAEVTKHKGKIPPELVGINKASTFTGFCSKHDTEFFAPLETQAFNALQEQCFLLAYRALAREIYTKDASAALSDVRKNADKGRPEPDQFAIQALSSSFDIGLAAGQRDNSRHLREMHECLLRGSFSSVRAYVVETAGPPPVMCSGGIFPEETFDGTKLHDLSDPSEHADLLTITSFYDGSRGYVALVWFPGSDTRCVPFVESLSAIPTNELTGALVRLIFEYLENTFIAPDWWESLTEGQRHALNNRMWGIADQFATGQSTGNIQPDGINLPSWAIQARSLIGMICANSAIQPAGEDASG